MDSWCLDSCCHHPLCILSCQNALHLAEVATLNTRLPQVKSALKGLGLAKPKLALDCVSGEPQFFKKNNSDSTLRPGLRSGAGQQLMPRACQRGAGQQPTPRACKVVLGSSLCHALAKVLPGSS